MTVRLGSLLLLAVMLVPRSGYADPLDDKIARVIADDRVRVAAEMGRRTFQRFRRSVTLGPTLSAAPAVTVDGGDVDVQIGTGLALVRYRIPTVPSVEELEWILLGGVKSAVVAQLEAATARGEVLSEEEQRRIVRETWLRIKDELMLKLHPRHFEQPGFELLGEVAYLPGDDAWDLRALVGIGISKVFVAAGVALQYDNGVAAAIPVEVSVPVLFTGSLRSPAAQVFVRADIAATRRDEDRDRAFVGVRLALDVL